MFNELDLFALYLFIFLIFFIFLCFGLIAKYIVMLLRASYNSKTDFILQISPETSFIKRIFFSKKRKPHYPPPGYGVPPNKAFKLKKEVFPDKYQMTMIPGGLTFWIFLMLVVLSLVALLPLSFVLVEESRSQLLLAAVFFIVVICLSFAAYYLIYILMARPVLSDIWAIWPEPCNHMLRSVPHKVKLSRGDKNTPKLKKYPIYWSPKSSTSFVRQPREYAPNIPTLQAVLLNFSLFELFFYKKPTSNEYSNVLNVRNWVFYWMFPVWGSYLFLSLFMIFYFWIEKTGSNDIAKYALELANLANSNLVEGLDLDQLRENIKNGSSPWGVHTFWEKGGSFVIAICLWMIGTAWFIHSRLAKMIEMKDKVSSGYFRRYEELVPQQVLQRLTEIPKEQQIASIIEKQRIIFNFLLFGAFVNYLLVLDAFK